MKTAASILTLTFTLPLTLSLSLAACAGKAPEPADSPSAPPVAAAPSGDEDAAPADRDADEAAVEDAEAEEDSAAASANLREVLEKRPEASRFLAELDKAGLINRLVSTDEDTTALIPTNEAFEQMPKALQARMNKPGEAAEILQYHLIPEKMDLNRVMEHRALPTLLGTDIPIKVVEGTTLLFGSEKERAKLIEANISGSNGYAHTIDRVLTPR